MRKKFILPALILAIAGITVFGISQVRAQVSGGNRSAITKKLVERFSLKENEVQAVFDEEHQERLAQMGAEFEEKLTQEVADGKLTAAQKESILAKRQELQKQHEELRNWAEENNIDPKYLMGGFGFGRKGGQRFDR